MSLCGTGDSQELLRTLGAAFEKANPGVSIVVPDSVGSDGGIKAAAAGECDFGRVARPLTDQEKELKLTYRVVCLFAGGVRGRPGDRGREPELEADRGHLLGQGRRLDRGRRQGREDRRRQPRGEGLVPRDVEQARRGLQGDREPRGGHGGEDTRGRRTAVEDPRRHRLPAGRDGERIEAQSREGQRRGAHGGERRSRESTRSPSPSGWSGRASSSPLRNASSSSSRAPRGRRSSTTTAPSPPTCCSFQRPAALTTAARAAVASRKRGSPPSRCPRGPGTGRRCPSAAAA